MLTIRDQQIGVLEVLMYLMGIIAVIAAVAWKWDLFLLLALILVAVPFLTFWEIQNLEHENEPSRRVRWTIANDGSVSQKQPSGGPVSRETEPHGQPRVHPPVSQTTVPSELKGIPHEPLECSKT